MSIKEKVEQARSLCGCIQCQGGYDIGARTLAMGTRGRGAGRPMSCLAAAALQRIFVLEDSKRGTVEGVRQMMHPDAPEPA